MPKEKWVEMLGITASGETTTGARERALQIANDFIERAKRGPESYLVHGVRVLIWPDVEGWSYAIFDGKHLDEQGPVRAQCSMTGTIRDARQSVVYAAVQRLWSYGVNDDAGFVREGFAPLGAGCEGTIRDLIDWCAWQRRWKAAHDAGADRASAHEIASKTRTQDEARDLAARIAA